MAYPDFVCIGFQKCGTTTLYNILAQHQDIALCRDVKEPMYYRIPFINLLGRGKHFYDKRYFGHIKPDDTRIKGEINAGLSYEGCAKKLFNDFEKDTKMIFMLRNPVDRSYSAYKYFLARGFLSKKQIKYDKIHGHSLGFDHYVHSVIDNEKKRSKIMKKRMKYLVFSQSNYAYCIKEYADKFGTSNMHFIIFEEFISDTQKTCNKLYDFLDTKDCDNINYDIHSNPGCECAISSIFAKIFMTAKGINYFLYDICDLPHRAPGIYKFHRKIYNWIRKRALGIDRDFGKVQKCTRDFLMKYFSKDISMLKDITGKDLIHIWNC